MRAREGEAPRNIVIETREAGIAVVTVSRPSVLNALNSETLRELCTQLARIGDDSAIRVCVLTGAGEKAFVAGADIAEMSAMSVSSGVEFSKLGQEVTKLLELMPKPTIAAVNGFALGGGTELAIACDFIIAAENAVFGQPEVGLGSTPGFGATVRLARFVGIARAKELLFSGRRIDAAEALRIGLVNRVVPRADLMKETLSLALAISGNSARAVRTAKKLANEFAETTGLSYKLDSEAREFGGLFGTVDQKEGMAAFLGKRKPRFEGFPP
jgi:enoyl-CoA hydratase